MKLLFRTILVLIPLLVLPFKKGLTGENIFSVNFDILFIEEDSGALLKEKKPSRIDPYFTDSEKIIKLSIKDCQDYLGHKEAYRDICNCAGWKAAEIGKKPSPVEDHGECHYKLMLAASMWICDNFIRKQKQQGKIKKLYDLMIEEVNAGMCNVK